MKLGGLAALLCKDNETSKLQQVSYSKNLLIFLYLFFSALIFNLSIHFALPAVVMRRNDIHRRAHHPRALYTTYPDMEAATSRAESWK